MSEYWVSKKRYFCKYCDIYIADDAPSRQHHENGMRHKGNKERFVRGLYKAGEKRKKDLEEERREMVRINQAAQAAFAQDVGAGHARASSSPSSSRAPPPPAAHSSKKPARSSGTFSNYSTAESLGYTDPDVEHARAEAGRRQTQGYAGEWQLVDSTPTRPPDPASEGHASPANGDKQPEEGNVAAGTKRWAEEDDESGRRWKLRKKTASVGLEELYDPGIIPVKLKPKKEEVKQETVELGTNGILGGEAELPTTSSSTSHVPQATTLPKWTATKWKKAGEPAIDEPNPPPQPSSSSEATHQSVDNASTPERHDEVVNSISIDENHHAPVKQEDPLKEEESDMSAIPTDTPSGSSMFRKRRIPAGGGAGARGRRF